MEETKRPKTNGHPKDLEPKGTSKRPSISWAARTTGQLKGTPTSQKTYQQLKLAKLAGYNITVNHLNQQIHNLREIKTNVHIGYICLEGYIYAHRV